MNPDKRPFRRLRMGDGFAAFGERSWRFALVLPLLLAPALGGGLYQYYHPETAKNPPELWQLGVIAGAVLLFTVILMLVCGRSLRIDAGGVTEKYLFRTRRLNWRQIHDYGFSYAGGGRARLYFADERLIAGSDGRKRRAGRCCSILLRRSEVKQSGAILNLCRQYTRIRPYLCTEDGKLAGVLKDR